MVAQQPQAASPYCRVINGQGRIGTGPVNDIDVTCGAPAIVADGFEL